MPPLPASHLSAISRTRMPPARGSRSLASPARRRSFASHLLRGKPAASVVTGAARSLAVMLEAHMPLEEALAAAARGAQDHRLQSALDEITQHVRAGSSLSQALAARDDMFGPFFRELARAGEASGTLGAALTRAASHLERRAALRRRLRLALAYPAFVLLVAAGAVAFLLTFVVPTFSDLFADFGADLPAPTQLVLKASTLLTEHLLLWISAALVIPLVLVRVKRLPRAARSLDRLLLKLPFIGTLRRHSETASVCRTLGALLAGGVPLAEALPIAASASESIAFRECLTAARHAVRQGRRLAPVLGRSALFPALALQLVEAGEETSALEEALIHIADYLDEDVDRQTETMLALIEPLLIVLVGTLLGGILIAMYLPMFDLGRLAG